ncbi:MAG: hypothetical protein JWP20_1839 [Roseomonas sp.]|nr:hypothetical protein [Roseomonas sp.]
MLRWFAWIATLLAALLVAAWLLVGRFDLGPLAAWGAAQALGRDAGFGALHLTPGRWITLALRDARLEGPPGGPGPMMEIGSASMEVDALSLLSGAPLIRRLALDGLRLQLGHAGGKDEGGKDAGGASGVRPAASAGASRRAGFPTLLDARLTGGEIIYRTSSGALLRIRLDGVALQAADAGQPVRMTASGAYNDVPITLEALLAPFTALRDAEKVYEADLRLVSGETKLRFQGGMTDPLALEGARGELALDAATPAAILAIAGVTSGLDPALRLSGTLEHTGPLWQLSQATGTLGEAAITAATLRLVEGARGQPDDVTVDLAFDRLDLDALSGEGRRGQRPGADFSLAVEHAPDTLVTARVTARQLTYAGVRATDARLAAALTPGRVAVEELRLGYQGARVRAEGKIEAAGGGQTKGGHVTAEVDFSGLEVQALRRVLGIGPVPVSGPMDGHVALVADGATLNTAARGAHLSAVVAMAGGSIARQAVEIASTDIRALFRTASGRSAISCLLGVLDIRAGAGTVSPLRIRSEHGTIAGQGRFDLLRQRLDLTISSEAATTGAYALDVPVHVGGSFGDPTIRPAQWTEEGRAQLAAGDDPGRLPPALRPFARRSPCLTSGRRP